MSLRQKSSQVVLGRSGWGPLTPHGKADPGICQEKHLPLAPLRAAAVPSTECCCVLSQASYQLPPAYDFSEFLLHLCWGDTSTAHNSIEQETEAQVSEITRKAIKQ